MQIYKKNGKSFVNSKKGYTFAFALAVKARSATLRRGFIKQRPIRLSARTQDFHSWKRGSIPLWATIKTKKEYKEMANHKSSLKRIRQTEKRNLQNRYYGKNMRSAVRSLRAMTDKNEALAKFPEVQKLLDRMAKRGLIHKNKAANLKSGLCARIAKLA